MNFSHLYEIINSKASRNKKLFFKTPFLLSNLFSNIVDLFQVQSQIQLSQNQVIKKINLINQIYYHQKSKQQSTTSQSLQIQPTFLYKTQLTLRFFMKKFIQQNNWFQLERIRLVFTHLEDYQAALQAQDIILYEFRQNKKKFFLLRCKYFCQRKFWRNNISFFPSDVWLKQVLQKKIDNQVDNYNLLNNLKNLSICLLSTSLAQESIQQFQKALTIIKQLQQNHIFLSQQKQILQTIRSLVRNILQLFDKFQVRNQNYKSSLVGMIKIMHQIYKTHQISPFIKFGQQTYLNIIKYSVNGEKAKRICQQYFSFFKKGTPLYNYQIQYLLERSCINNQQLNCFLVNMFSQILNKIEINSLFIGVSSMNTLISYFHKTYQDIPKLHKLSPQLTYDFTLLYQKIINFCSQNKCLQKMNPSHLIFAKFYIDLNNQGIQKSTDNMIQYFKLNQHNIPQNSQIFSQITECVRFIMNKSMYRQVDLNLLLDKYSHKSLEHQELIKNCANLVLNLKDMQDPSKKCLQMFRNVHIVAIKNINQSTPHFSKRVNEVALHNNALNMAEMMAMQEIKQTLQKVFIKYSLQMIYQNYIHSVIIFILLWFYLLKLNTTQQRLKSINIEIQSKSKELIILELQKMKKLLKLSLVGIYQIQNISLRKYYLSLLYLMKSIHENKSQRKKLILLRSLLSLNSPEMCSRFHRTIKNKVKEINHRFGKVKRTICVKIENIQLSMELSINKLPKQ